MNVAPTIQKPKTRSVFLFSLEEQVKPDSLEDYFESTKKWIDTMKALHSDLSFSAFGNDDGYTDYNQQIAGLADAGLALETWRKAAEILHATEWGKKRLAAVKWSRYSIWELVPDISYEPKHPNPKQLTYFVWKSVHIRPEMEETFIATAIKIRELVEKTDIDRGCNVFRNVIGYEGPSYTFIFSGKDPDEFHSWRQQVLNKLSQQLDPLLHQLDSSIEENKEFQAWSKPELSMPSK
jgi:hypothetical protein